MPAFLMFEEFGLDPDMNSTLLGLAKAGMRLIPMSYVKHGIIGEYNVDIDPIAELRETMNGGGALGTMGKNLASGNVVGALTEFSEAYKGWITVSSITSHTIHGAWEAYREKYGKRTKQGQGSSNGANGAQSKQRTSETEFKKNEKEEREDRGQMELSIELDASFPQLVTAALKIDDEEKQTRRIFKVAEVHMCTTAQVDVSQLTLGNNSPAASLIQSLVGAMLFNVIPYLTISMRNVTITGLGVTAQGKQDSPPDASLKLAFEKATWTYYVINQSNMNLINVSTEFDFTKPLDAKMKASAGSLVNPFG